MQAAFEAVHTYGKFPPPAPMFYLIGVTNIKGKYAGLYILEFQENDNWVGRDEFQELIVATGFSGKMMISSRCS